MSIFKKKSVKVNENLQTLLKIIEHLDVISEELFSGGHYYSSQYEFILYGYHFIISPANVQVSLPKENHCNLYTLFSKESDILTVYYTIEERYKVIGEAKVNDIFSKLKEVMV